MKNPLGLRILTSALAGILSLSMVACPKPADTTDMPAPSTTVGTQLDDSVITTKVKAALLENDGIKGLDIQVETRKGEVMLSGFVDSQAQVDGAVALTRGIEGVNSVDNKLSLKNGETSMGNKLDDSVVTTRSKPRCWPTPASKAWTSPSTPARARCNSAALWTTKARWTAPWRLPGASKGFLWSAIS